MTAEVLRLLQASSCFRGEVCASLPCACAETLAALSRPAQGALPPLVDRAELVALLEDLASVNLSPEACSRQAARMADDLIARGMAAVASTPSVPAKCAPMQSTSYPAETAMTAQGALKIAANIAEDRGWMGKPYPGVEIAKAIRDVAKKGYWTRDSALTSTECGET